MTLAELSQEEPGHHPCHVSILVTVSASYINTHT